MFLVEKQQLTPASPLLSLESNPAVIIPRNVNKDNTTRFKSNRYSSRRNIRSQKDNQVYLEIQGEQQNSLVICKQPDNTIIAEHPISTEKGKLIKNRSHSRDRSQGIEELKSNVISYFEEKEAITMYLDEICLKYVRYRRDQLAIFQTVIKNGPEWIDQAL